MPPTESLVNPPENHTEGVTKSSNLLEVASCRWYPPTDRQWSNSSTCEDYSPCRTRLQTTNSLVEIFHSFSFVEKSKRDENHNILYNEKNTFSLFSTLDNYKHDSRHTFNNNHQQFFIPKQDYCFHCWPFPNDTGC
jgi:hypothetical protein